MSRTTVTFLSIVPFIVILLAALGVLVPRKSNTPNHPSPDVATSPTWFSSPPRPARQSLALQAPAGGGEEVIKNIPLPGGERVRVRVGSTELNVEIAATPAARQKGLSGHAPLGDNEGMLFVFDKPSIQTFWMIDMLFPLDIIWIGADKNVLGITANVPTPLPGTSSDKLPLYSSPGPTQYVLEVNAGWAKVHGVKVGDSVIR